MASALASAAAESATRFAPDTGGLRHDDLLAPLPTQWNISDSQSLYTGFANSYWSSSYISGDDGHEYLVLSHVLASSAMGVYRGSILDITDPSYFQQFTSFWNASSWFATNQTALNFALGDEFYFGLASDDKLGPITTWNEAESFSYNLTYDLSSPLMLNGGSGSFLWTTPTLVNEWSMPAGKTTGTITKKGTEITVDTEKSFTWYDRQWQAGPSTNWTWFELHIQTDGEEAVSRLSTWFYPAGWTGGAEKGFATIRKQPGVQIVSPAAKVNGDRVWTSPVSNVTYNLDWTLELEDGTTLYVSNVRDDQELADSAGFFVTYEGFVEVTGQTSSGESITGFGLVEIEPVQSS
ncbi:hypothetical protein Daus18300_000403 [Diaporthe australafricana]|uniref:AttH domain-containing protein n=1 Tax=Diaporthe australafricana TaxID=127596 RepID=A0ABR3Y4X3_9PEZI